MRPFTKKRRQGTIVQRPEFCGVSLARLICVGGLICLLYWSEKIALSMQANNFPEKDVIEQARTVLPGNALKLDTQRKEGVRKGGEKETLPETKTRIASYSDKVSSNNAKVSLALRGNHEDYYLKPETYYQRRDYKVNPHDFHYIIAEEKFCQRLEEPPHLLVLVNSYHDRQESRSAVRKTWGSVSQTQAWVDGTPVKEVIKVLFFIGQHIVSTWNKRIGYESEIYSDIILEDYTESPFNASIKTIGALKWAVNYCPGAKYVLKVEEDVFVNVPAVLRILSHSNTMYGARHAQFTVQREGQWAVPRSIFPFETFPMYLGGPAYGMSIDLAKRIYETSEYFPRIVLEDAFVTGILREVVKAEIKQLAEFGSWGSRQPTSCEIALGRIITGNRLEAEDVLMLWKDLQDSDLKRKCDESTF